MEMKTDHVSVDILLRFPTYVFMVSLQQTKVAEALIYKLSSLISNISWQPHKFYVKIKITFAFATFVS